MHMLVILILMTAAHQHNTIARASDFCEPGNVPSHAVPFNEKHPVNTKIRIQCAEGYTRKAGTSNQIICTKMKDGTTNWHTKLPLVCIPDPKKPPVTKTTTSTTERTELKNPTVLGTSMPTTVIVDPEATIGYYTSKVSGVTSIIIICLICLAAAAVFLMWLWLWWRWRLRHRERDSPEASYIPVQLVYLNTDQMNQTLQSTNPQQALSMTQINHKQAPPNGADNM